MHPTPMRVIAQRWIHLRGGSFQELTQRAMLNIEQEETQRSSEERVARETFMLWECKTKKIPGVTVEKGSIWIVAWLANTVCASDRVICDSNHSIVAHGAEFQGITFQMNIKEIL